MDCWYKTSPKKRFNSNQTLPLSFEIHSYKIFENLIEKLLIFNANQPIFKDSWAFMSPKLNKITFISKRFVSCLSYTLKHFRKISQVINVMRFSWSRQQLFWCLYFVVELDSWPNDVIFKISNIFGKNLRQVSKIPF